MPLRRAFAVVGLCLACGSSALAAEPCDLAPLPPNPSEIVRDYNGVSKLIQEFSQLRTPMQAVPLPRGIPNDPEQRAEFLAPWNEQLEAYKATHLYKETEDLDLVKSRGKIPSGDEVVCHENVAVIAPDGHRVTMTAGEFVYFLRYRAISAQNYNALNHLFASEPAAVAVLKPAKVKRFLGWLRKDVSFDGRQPDTASR